MEIIADNNERRSYPHLNNPKPNTDHSWLAVFFVDGEIEILTMSNPNETRELIEYLETETCGHVTLAGIYGRVFTRETILKIVSAPEAMYQDEPTGLGCCQPSPPGWNSTEE